MSISQRVRSFVRCGAMAALTLLSSPAQAGPAYCGTPQQAVLYAGQTTNAGVVTIGNDANFLYVTFTTTGEWRMKVTHLHVADVLAGVPMTRTGNPKIGNFTYQTTHSLITSFTYTIAKSALSLDPNKSVVVAAHAEVARVDSGGTVLGTETGWAAGKPFTDKGSWATYANYLWQECLPDPVIETRSETAFAHPGGYAGNCFLNLDLDANGVNEFNRWGWTVGPLSEGVYRFNFYAGAGKCDINKGTLVGYIDVSYAGGTATVTFRTAGVNPATGVAYNLVEAHLYVGSEVLPRDVNGEFTVAPGQYPDISGELKAATSKSFQVSGLSGKVYIVAHASVAGFPL